MAPWVTTLACLAALAGCGSDDAAAPPSAPEAAPAAATALNDYDLVVTASAENNTLFADVYGIRLNPLRADRITSGKRISFLDANAERMVVAAADGPTDRLAYVRIDGELEPIPGLGRPFAYTPSLLPDGTILYHDFIETSTGDVNRYRAWDPQRRSATTVFRSRDELLGLTPGPGGRLALTRANRDGDTLIVRNAGGKLREFALDLDGSYKCWGRTHIAVTVNAGDSRFGDKPNGMLLVDPSNGSTTAVPGWQAIAWTADGSKLLARGTTDLASSELAFIDPASPSTPEAVGTIPDLAIYDGAWVHGVA